MKAISLWEPYASLVRTGAKTFETRSWKTNYRGELLICASKRCRKSEITQMLSFRHFQRGLAELKGLQLGHPWPGIRIENLNFGKAVAVVNLVDCIKTDDLTLKEIDQQEYFSDFSFGRYAWKLEMVNNTFYPFPVKGKQGFFNVPVNVSTGNKL